MNITHEEKWKIIYSIEMAFEYWRWLWQVDLEEHMDNSSYFDAFLWVLYDKKTAMPLHTVSNWWNINSRPVRYNLRSNTWRQWIKKTTKKAIEQIINNLF